VLVKFKIESYYIDHRLKVWKHLRDLINNNIKVHTVKKNFFMSYSKIFFFKKLVLF